MAGFPHKVFGLDVSLAGDFSDIVLTTDGEIAIEPERCEVFPSLEALKSAQTIQAVAAAIAEARGFDPDQYASMFEAEVEGVIKPLAVHLRGEGS